MSANFAESYWLKYHLGLIWGYRPYYRRREGIDYCDESIAEVGVPKWRDENFGGEIQMNFDFRVVCNWIGRAVLRRPILHVEREGVYGCEIRIAKGHSYCPRAHMRKICRRNRHPISWPIVRDPPSRRPSNSYIMT